MDDLQEHNDCSKCSDIARERLHLNEGVLLQGHGTKVTSNDNFRACYVCGRWTRVHIGCHLWIDHNPERGGRENNHDT